MAQFRSLLLPLALIFAAIAVFEFGARYGATNMRAVAIAEQTQLTMEIFSKAHSMMDEQAKASYLLVIDRSIASGALHRNIWHLSGDAQDILDRSLAEALSIRGNDVVKRFEAMQESEGISAAEKENLTKIQEALRSAKEELIDSKVAADME